MSKKLFLLLVTMFTMVFFVKGQENAKKAAVPKANAEVEQINSAAGAKATPAGKDLKPRIELTLPKEAEEAPEAEESSWTSWFSWLWPFSSEDEEAAADIPEGETAVTPAPTDAPANANAPAEPELAAGQDAQEEEGIDYLHNLAIYFPNLGMDFLDIFSIRLAAGAEAGAEARITRYCQFGGKYGDSYFIEHKFNRRNGGGYYNGYDYSLAAIAGERRFLDPAFGDIRHYICKEGKPKIVSYEDKLYKEDVRDFWAVGFDAGWLVNVRFDFHPIEFADFFYSLATFDLTGDNQE